MLHALFNIFLLIHKETDRRQFLETEALYNILLHKCKYKLQYIQTFPYVEGEQKKSTQMVLGLETIS